MSTYNNIIKIQIKISLFFPGTAHLSAKITYLNDQTLILLPAAL